MRRLFAVPVVACALLAASAGPASARWVDGKPYSSGQIAYFCHIAAGTYQWVNVDGTAGGNYCRGGAWAQPGAVCKYSYGGSYRFVMTNYYDALGGYCARWV